MKNLRNSGIIILLAVLIGLLNSCENNNDTENADGDLSGMRIVPASIHLNTNQTEHVFTAEGGIPPYTWEVSDNSLGNVEADAFQTARAIYTRNGNTSGQNTIRVTDSHNTNATQNASWSALATVVQD